MSRTRVQASNAIFVPKTPWFLIDSLAEVSAAFLVYGTSNFQAQPAYRFSPDGLDGEPDRWRTAMLTRPDAPTWPNTGDESVLQLTWRRLEIRVRRGSAPSKRRA